MHAAGAARRVSSGWSGLLAELDAAGGAGGGEAGLLRALAAPSASEGSGGGGGGSVCWADTLDLDAVFDMGSPHAPADAPAGVFLVQDAAALPSEHAAQLGRALLQPPVWAAGGGLRCLDATHSADCSRCVNREHRERARQLRRHLTPLLCRVPKAASCGAPARRAPHARRFHATFGRALPPTNAFERALAPGSAALPLASGVMERPQQLRACVARRCAPRMRAPASLVCAR